MKKRGMLFFILAMLWLGTIHVFGATVLPTDVAEASAGCTLLGIRGKYIVQIPQALQRINEIRKEACEEGVINPSTGKPLTSSDYVPIRWSSDLEYIARIRAAEASVTMDHTRTNGDSCFAITSPQGVDSYGEVIAWNGTETMVSGINQWYEEKADWVKQNSNAVTGHYTQMIAPENRYIGLGTFCSDSALYYNTTVGEFSYQTGLNEAQGRGYSDCVQILEVNRAYLGSSYTVSGTTSGKRGERAQLDLTTSVRMTDYWGNTVTTNGLMVLSPVSWISSNSAVASVSSSGVVTANRCGTAQITARDASGHSGTVSFRVNHTAVTDPAVAATCLKTGKTAGSHCSVCGEILKAQKSVPKRKPTIKVTASSLTMKVKQKTTGFKVWGLGAGDYVKSWKSNKTSVVKVSGKEDGTCTITAQKKTGSAKITITLASGLKKTITVKVQKKAVQTAKISGLSKKIRLKIGKKVTLKPVISPITSAQKVSYSSSNKKIASVSKNGVITAKKSGTAKITVKSGSKKFVVTVTVPKAKTTAIQNVASAKTLKRGKSYTLKPKLVPSNSGDKITYSSSNKKVATVSSKGKITAKKKGTAVITVKSGKVSVKCRVTVK